MQHYQFLTLPFYYKQIFFKEFLKTKEPAIHDKSYTLQKFLAWKDPFGISVDPDEKKTFILYIYIYIYIYIYNLST